MPQPAKFPQITRETQPPPEQAEQREQSSQPSQDDSGSDESAFVSIPIGASSQIASANYNSKTLDLVIQFQNGSTYLYKNVDQVIVNGLASADSPGRFFARNIRGVERFEYERLD